MYFKKLLVGMVDVFYNISRHTFVNEAQCELWLFTPLRPWDLHPRALAKVIVCSERKLTFQEHNWRKCHYL